MRVDPHSRALVSFWHDQPREERALRGGRALNVRELSPRGRQSRGTTRAHKLLVHVPAALCGCWDPSYWWTYQRHCGMLGPEILVFVPAALCERWAQGFEARAGTPRRATNPKTGGRRPEERSSSQVTPQLFFNTAGAFKPVSLELYTVSAHVVRRPAWFDFDCAVSEVVASLALSCSYSLSLSIFRRTSLRVPCPWNSAFVGSNESVGPVAVVSEASLDMDDLYSILSSQRGTRSDSSAPMHGGSPSTFPSLWSFVRRSSHSLWLRVLRHVSVFAPS